MGKSCGEEDGDGDDDGVGNSVLMCGVSRPSRIAFGCTGVAGEGEKERCRNDVDGTAHSRGDGVVQSIEGRFRLSVLHSAESVFPGFDGADGWMGKKKPNTTTGPRRERRADEFKSMISHQADHRSLGLSHLTSALSGKKSSEGSRSHTLAQVTVTS